MDDYDDSAVTQEGVDERHAKAYAEKDCHLVEALPDQLLVDIDSYEDLGIFHANYSRLGELALSHERKPSPSRKSGRASSSRAMPTTWPRFSGRSAVADGRG